MLLDLPNELANIICSYVESPTYKLIRDLCFDPFYECINPYECLKLNKKYNFKHIHIPRLLDAINRRCPYCINRLKPEEYLYRGKYEICFNKKLCFECLEKETFRLYFEISELILIMLICIFVWSSILKVV
jgi:hypothetical protein